MAPLIMVSCHKEFDVGVLDNEEAEEKTLTIKLWTDKPSTRALDSSTPIDDGLQRLDLYIYHEDEPETDFHVTLTPDPSGVTTYTVKEKKGERIGVLAFGNLDDDTAAHLDGKTLEQLADEYEAEAKIVWSANNFSPDKIVMVGKNYYDFDEDGAVDVEMKRIMYRIDIGEIAVDPINTDLVGREIYVKNIALTNIGNYFFPLKSESIGHFYTWYLFFGNSYTNMTDAFGGVTSGFKYYQNSCKGWSINGTFSMEEGGDLNGTFPYTINPNYQKDKGVLNITAEGVIKEATHQAYDNSAGEGLIAASGYTSAPQSLAINKCLYGFIGRGCFTSYDIVSDYSKQNDAPKLVIELSIDGVSWFYPIQLTYMQPNTVYKIEKITIKDYGSEYSNFYPQKHVVDVSVSIENWTELEISNVNLGADTLTGELVDMYDTTE